MGRRSSSRRFAVASLTWALIATSLGVVERQPVDLQSQTAGDSASGTVGLDPSIQLRPRQPRADRPAGVSTELVDERTERTVTNPDGSFTFEAASGRLNYLDADGAWQRLDLSLVEDLVGPFSHRVRSHDRTIRFGSTDPESALVALSSDLGTIGFRPLDFEGRLVPARTSPLVEVVEPSPSPPEPSPTIRPATRREVSALPNWTSVGPIELERAAQALAGIGTWSEDYEIFLPPSEARSRPGPLRALLNLRSRR